MCLNSESEKSDPETIRRRDGLATTTTRERPKSREEKHSSIYLVDPVNPEAGDRRKG